MTVVPGRCGGVSLADLGLARMPVRRDGTVVDWGAPIRRAWGACSEEEALQMMEGFIAVGEQNRDGDHGVGGWGHQRTLQVWVPPALVQLG